MATHSCLFAQIPLSRARQDSYNPAPPHAPLLPIIARTTMQLDGRSLVAQITELHRRTVETWHHEELTNPYDGLLAIVCRQHQFNYLLWHEEDVARSPDVTDDRIAAVKRTIDHYNQQRNDWIEKLDEALLAELRRQDISAGSDSPANTETPGSVVDRLSILALRIYHYREQLERTDAVPDHRIRVEERLATCLAQHADLSESLAQLIEDIFAGRKVLKLYRQLKMYNDPTLNPYLYSRRKAG